MMAILLVGRSEASLDLINSALGASHEIKTAASGAAALQILAGEDLADLILLDVELPDLSGWEVCRRIRADARLRRIPVLFLIADADAEDEARVIEMGAADYLSKPLNPVLLKSRVATHLALRQAADLVHRNDHNVAVEMERRAREIAALQDATILAMASLAEARDNETGNHIRRTQLYIGALAEQLKSHPNFAPFLAEAQIEALVRAAPLHDIGKVGIPDHILLKPGKLTDDEFEVMKTHTTIGDKAIAAAQAAMPYESAFLQCAREIALSHHEMWDGSGYPYGLKGEEIPLSARLMAVADVYDALISRRPYKEPFRHDEALAMIEQGSGTHFQPEIVSAFLAISDKVADIARRLKDDAAQPL